jgi:hypothetical protein
VNHGQALAALERVTSWRKSRRSDANGNCVEVNFEVSGWVGVRDSKVPDGPIHAFTLAEWRAFVGGVADGEFSV